MHESMSTELMVVSLLAFLLILGSITRSLSKRFNLPFTVFMLFLGSAAGLGLRMLGSPHLLETLGLTPGSPFIDPELIILVFLPALIFESALSLDAHVFRKSLGGITLLALPALLLCTGLTAIFVKFALPADWGWGWNAALLFGVLISATDPVAVVAILRELGLSKRLVTVIEGESLLNDGVAIVFFQIFLAALTVTNFEFSVSDTTIHVVKVVGGGLLIGLILAMITSFWIGRIFNDPLIEIPLTLALAYTAMLVAEDLFHVSGIMAIVMAGLWMASKGRTRISPEVTHSLHDFWGMLGYIANTVIFFLVGFAITFQIKSVEWAEVGIVLMIYVAIMVIRLSVLYIMRPPLALVGEKMSTPKLLVVSWGGLRGAVSLALALTVSQIAEIPEDFRDKLLLITSGVVALTILVNGISMKYLLKAIGLDQAPLGQRRLPLLSRLRIVDSLRAFVAETSGSRAFAGVSWKNVNEYVDERGEDLKGKIDRISEELSSSDQIDQIVGFWTQILNQERTVYWKLFDQGVLDRDALNTLIHEIDIQLDNLNEGITEAPSSRIPHEGQIFRNITHWIEQHPFLYRRLKPLFFGRLRRLYHLYKAAGHAARSILESLNHQDIEEDIQASIKDVYTGYLRNSQENVEEMRIHLPEVIQTVEQHLALRMVLNHEREGYHKLHKSGVVDEHQLNASLEQVEERMKVLEGLVDKLALPTAEDLIKEVPLFSYSSPEAQATLAKKATDIIIPKGAFLFQEGEQGDSLYIIVRGLCEVLKNIDGVEKSLTLLGGGDIVGEMALLTGQPRMASIQAVTTVTVLRISADAFREICTLSPQILEETWRSYGVHLLDNHLRDHDSYRSLSQNDRHAWIKQTSYVHLKKDQSVDTKDLGGLLYILAGAVQSDGKDTWSTKNVLIPITSTDLRATEESRLLILPPFR